MISTNKRRLYGEVYNDVRCLSTDEKPKDVKNGSTLVEIDTGDVYMFDAEGVTWNQLPSSGGGGGGPQPASVVPLMDGVANAGSSEKYARADHIHPTDTSRASTAVATTSANGLMSATDKRKLGGIESGANAYTLPTMTATTKGGAKLGDGLTITDGALGIDPEPQESTGEVRGAIASLTAKGWATQDGTPTPSNPVAIQVAQGRNLYRETIYAVGQTWSPVNTLTVTKRGYNEYSISGNSTGTHWLYGGGGDLSDGLFVNLGAGTYVASISGDASNLTIAVRGRVNGAQTTIASGASPLSFTLAEATDVKVTVVTIANKTFSNQRCMLQLELGSTAHNYVPYGHVGIDITHDGTTTTRPVPLPSKGYAASLPDDTADVLTIDGAGKVEWLSAVARIESYAGETVGDVYLSTTGELTTGAEVYYPLVTPAKEQVGYIDWPSIPDVAIITCPELDDLGVRYLIGNGVAEMARQWYERAKSEYESRISALEQAVAELATA